MARRQKPAELPRVEEPLLWVKAHHESLDSVIRQSTHAAFRLSAERRAATLTRRTAGMASPNREAGRDGGAAAIAGINKHRGCAVFIRDAAAGLGGTAETVALPPQQPPTSPAATLPCTSPRLGCRAPRLIAAREFSDVDLEADATHREQPRLALVAERLDVQSNSAKRQRHRSRKARIYRGCSARRSQESAVCEVR